MTRLYDALADKTVLEPIAMSAATVLPILLLQKPHQRSKAKEHTSCLTRRLESWLKGDIIELLNEGRTIPNRLIDKQNLAKKEKLEKRCAKLMRVGKIHAAIKLLSSEQDGVGILPLNMTITQGEGDRAWYSTVKEILESKHPAASELLPEAMESNLD